jgi:hypothetical protein
MSDLSLKGVARRFLGFTEDLSVINNVFRRDRIEGTVSLRERLESVARTEREYRMRECIFRWDAACEQTWTHIVVRIKLRPRYDVSHDDLSERAVVWRRGIEQFWNNKGVLAHGGEFNCRFRFDVEWVTDNEHHKVNIRPGSGETDMTHWYMADGEGVAAHEFGHMIGLVDEYVDEDCEDRHPTNTDNVMDDNRENIPPRLLQHLARFLGEHAVALPDRSV